MIVCDEYLAISAVSETLPPTLAGQTLVTTHSTYGRLLRVIEALGVSDSPYVGKLSRLVRQWSEDEREQFRVAPHIGTIALLDPRPFLGTTAHLSARHRVSWLAAELLAAALHHQAPLWVGDEQNLPRGISAITAAEGGPEIHISGGPSVNLV